VSKKDTLINASGAKSVHLVKKWSGWNASSDPPARSKLVTEYSIWKGPASGISEYPVLIDGIWQNNAGSALYQSLPHRNANNSLRRPICRL